jgi:hypothetical protein
VIRRSAVTVTVSALVSGLDAELQRLGYKDPTLVWYRGCWRRMERFFAARGVEEFSLDVAMAWVDESCGFFEKERSGTLKPEFDSCWAHATQTWALTRDDSRSPRACSA